MLSPSFAVLRRGCTRLFARLKMTQIKHHSGSGDAAEACSPASAEQLLAAMTGHSREVLGRLEPLNDCTVQTSDEVVFQLQKASLTEHSKVLGCALYTCVAWSASADVYASLKDQYLICSISFSARYTYIFFCKIYALPSSHAHRAL